MSTDKVSINDVIAVEQQQSQRYLLKKISYLRELLEQLERTASQNPSLVGQEAKYIMDTTVGVLLEAQKLTTFIRLVDRRGGSVRKWQTHTDQS